MMNTIKKEIGKMSKKGSNLNGGKSQVDRDYFPGGHSVYQ
jgi:hypothetical protein